MITAKINTAEKLVEYDGKETSTASVSVDKAGKSISVDVKRNPGRMQVVHNGTVVSYDGSSDQVFSIDEEVAKGSDLTQEIADRKSADELLNINLTKAIEAEASDRKIADDETKSSISGFSSELASAKKELAAAIESESASRITADKAVEGDFSALKNSISKKVDALDADVISYGKRLTAEEENLAAETSERKSEDAKLAADIEAIEQALPTIDEGLESAVHKTGDETIEGTKSFSGDIIANKTITSSDYDTVLFAKPIEVAGKLKCYGIDSDGVIYGSSMSTKNLTSTAAHFDTNIDALCMTFFGTDSNSRIYYDTGDDEHIGVVAKNKDSSLLPMTFECSEIDVGCNIIPSSDSAYALGDSSHQWGELHAKSIWCDSLSASSISSASVFGTTLSASTVRTNAVKAVTNDTTILSYDGTSLDFCGNSIYIGDASKASGTGTVRITPCIVISQGGWQVQNNATQTTYQHYVQFDNAPHCSVAPTEDKDLANKAYVDSAAEAQATEKANAEQSRAETAESSLRDDVSAANSAIQTLQNKRLYLHNVMVYKPSSQGTDGCDIRLIMPVLSTSASDITGVLSLYNACISAYCSSDTNRNEVMATGSLITESGEICTVYYAGFHRTSSDIYLSVGRVAPDGKAYSGSFKLEQTANYCYITDCVMQVL